MEYRTIADLDGCPEKDCPLAEWCDWMQSMPAGTQSDPPCSRFPQDYPIEDAVDETRGRATDRAEYYARKWKKEDEDKARKAEIQKKRRATLAKNRDVNRERARLRARKRLAERMGITEKHVDLLGELMSIQRNIPFLAMARGDGLSSAMARIKAIGAEIEEESKKSHYHQAKGLVDEMMRG